MAIGSKKGACSANVQPAKANCLEHNRRNEISKKVPSYVNKHLSHLNHTIFEDDMIKDRKSIYPLIKRAEKLYTDKTGQKCQKSFVPFREDVLSLPCRGNITDEQIKKYIKAVEDKFHIKVVGAWYHKDEGHPRSKYVEGDEDFEINFHIHILYYCQDLNTGKAIRLPRSFYTMRQDFLADATGMERGNPAVQTGLKHRKSAEERIIMQEQRIKDLEDREQEQLQLIKHLKLLLALKEKAMGLLKQSSKDKIIKDLQSQITTLQGKLEAADKRLTTQTNNSSSERQELVKNANRTIREQKSVIKDLRVRLNIANEKVANLTKECKSYKQLLQDLNPPEQDLATEKGMRI